MTTTNPTSLERFAEHLAKIDPSVTLKTAPVKVVVTDRSPSAWSQGRKTVDATLYTIIRQRDWSKYDHVVQALFDDEGRFLAATESNSGLITLASEIEAYSRHQVSKPFGWNSARTSLTDTLVTLISFSATVIQAEKALSAKRDAEYAEEEAKRVQARYEQDLATIQALRANAAAALGDAATPEVLAYFLPLPEKGE